MQKFHSKSKVPLDHNYQQHSFALPKNVVNCGKMAACSTIGANVLLLGHLDVKKCIASYIRTRYRSACYGTPNRPIKSKYDPSQP